VSCHLELVKREEIAFVDVELVGESSGCFYAAENVSVSSIPVTRTSLPSRSPAKSIFVTRSAVMGPAA
jgi:hypothetical protein